MKRLILISIASLLLSGCANNMTSQEAYQDRYQYWLEFYSDNPHMINKKSYSVCVSGDKCYNGSIVY